jgi:T-complex protein 1 subunit gamma
MGVARNVIKDAKLVPGGGASEMAVAAILKKKSMSIEGVEQVGHPVCKDLVI